MLTKDDIDMKEEVRSRYSMIREVGLGAFSDSIALEEDELEIFPRSELHLRRMNSVLARMDGLAFSSNVVDVGCGDGFLAYAMKLAGFKRILCLDISLVRVRRVASRLKVPALLADASRIPLPDSCCDIVICSEVLEHLPDPSLAVREAYRTLEEGGVAIFTVPSKTNLDDVFRERVFRVDPDFGFRFSRSHLHYHDQSAMEELLSMSGFHIREVRGIFCIFPLFSRVSRIGGIIASAARILERLLSCAPVTKRYGRFQLFLCTKGAGDG